MTPMPSRDIYSDQGFNEVESSVSHQIFHSVLLGLKYDYTVIVWIDEYI